MENLYNVEIIEDDRIIQEYTLIGMEQVKEYVKIFRNKGYKVRVWELINI